VAMRRRRSTLVDLPARRWTPRDARDLKQYSHDFSGAMQDLEAATREDANNARAWSGAPRSTWCRRITKRHGKTAGPAEARSELTRSARTYLAAPRQAAAPTALLGGVCQECDARPK